MVHFGDVEVYHAGRYDGRNDPASHLIECQTLWTSRPRDEWVHTFFHTLEEMPRSWYVAAKLRRTITTWEEFQFSLFRSLASRMAMLRYVMIYTLYMT